MWRTAFMEPQKNPSIGMLAIPIHNAVFYWKVKIQAIELVSAIAIEYSILL